MKVVCIIFDETVGSSFRIMQNQVNI